MRIIQAIMAALIMLAAAPDGALRAQGGEAFHVVTYIEVTPSSQQQVAALLADYGSASRRQDGNLRFELLHRTERPSHFAIIEAWTDQKAFDAHAAADSTKAFR